MQKKSLTLLCVLLTFVMLTLALTACSIGTTEEQPEPAPVTLKTDLHDAAFTFTYGQLKTVLPTELLSALFENYAEKDDTTTITLNYNELKNRYENNEDEELFSKVLGLLPAEERAKLSENSTEALEYYNRSVNAIKAQKPATVYSESFWVDDSSIRFTDTEGKSSDENTPLAKGARLYKDMIMGGISAALPNEKSVEAGTDLNDILYLLGSDTVSLLTLADIDAIYTSVSETTENNSKDEAVVTELTRTVEIHLKNNEKSIEKAISFRDHKDILGKLNRTENSFTVSEYTLVPQDCVIIATFNAATDELLSLSYDKQMVITAAVTGEGSLAVYGAQTLDFRCGGNTFYKFGWDSSAT